jgi:signal transduction histidine kinase
MTSTAATETAGNILIIDDTPNNLRFLSSLLTEAGYAVRKVINGELGLEAAQLEPPDLILLDIMMPGMNGYEVCQRLKTSDRTRQVPVIFLSALEEELEKVQAFQMGGVDYITKPFQVVEVLARIETHLKMSRLQAQLLQQNLQLQQEIETRTTAEAALHILNQGLEAHVQERTARLQTDNQQLLQAQSELQAALSQEQRLNQLKSQFITRLAQDLRTPLTLITTTADLLKREMGDRPEQTNHHAQRIADSVQRINQTLERLSVLIDPGMAASSFNVVSVDLVQHCQTMLEQWQESNSQHPISFVQWGTLPAQVQLNQTLWQQALTQLLSNAAQYSLTGSTILFELIGEPDIVTVRIRDEGIGIPPDEVDRVFEQFYRASNASALTNASQLGLGLAIAKRAIEHHQGTITVSSELGKGTIVTIDLPLRGSSAS